MSNYRRRLLLANQTDELYLYGKSVQDGTPTPEAPIDIMSVENPTIKVVGKNLFNKETVERLPMYFGTDSWWIASDSSSFRIECKPNKSYVISGENPSCTIFRAGYTITDDLPIEGIGVKLYNIKRHSSFSQPIIITTGDDAKYIVVQVNSGAWDENIEKLQIEEGVVASKYEPYEEEIITINQNTPFGKNLLKPLSSVTTDALVKYDASSGDGSIIINAADERASASSISLYSGDLNELLKDGETYTLAMDVNEVKPLSLIICATNKDTKKNVYFNANNYKKFIMSITIDKSKYIYRKIYLQIVPNSYKYENIVVKPILAKGSYTELPFEQYVPPITTMRGIGNYKDRIYTKDGKVWFEQNIFHIKPSQFSRSGEGNRAIIASLPHPNDYGTYSTKKSNFGKYSLDYTITRSLHWYLTKTDSKVSQIWMVPSKEYCDLWTTKEEAWKHLTKTLGIYPEFQYVLEAPILTEITGSLAEQILAIDKTKNITITSENGVSGSAEVIVK